MKLTLPAIASEWIAGWMGEWTDGINIFFPARYNAKWMDKKGEWGLIFCLFFTILGVHYLVRRGEKWVSSICW